MIEIFQTFDAEFLSLVLSDPSLRTDLLEEYGDPAKVLEWVSEALRSNKLIALAVGEDQTPGGVLFLSLEEGKIVLHTALLPGFRGKKTIDVFHELLNWLKANTVLTELFTYSRPDKKHVTWMAKRVGFDEVGRSDTLVLFRKTL